MGDYRNKCGSCLYWERDKNTKHGWCNKRKFEPDVVCDPEHPFPVYSASHAKCPCYLYMPILCENCKNGCHWDGVVICDKDAQRHDRTDGCERGERKRED